MEDLYSRGVYNKSWQRIVIKMRISNYDFNVRETG